MLDFLILICLLLLVFGHILLIRGCFELPNHLNTGVESLDYRVSTDFDLLTRAVDNVHSAVDNGSKLVDELVQVLVEIVPEPTPNHPLFGILKMLMPNTDHSLEHGNKTQPQEWEVLERNDTQTTQTETIIDGNSPVDSNR